MKANSGDPDHTSPSAASDLGLHYLSMSHKKDARLIWVNSGYLQTGTSSNCEDSDGISSGSALFAKVKTNLHDKNASGNQCFNA